MIYNLVKQKPDYVDKLMDSLPMQKRYTEENCLDSPFGFYCGYMDLVRPLEIKS